MPSHKKSHKKSKPFYTKTRCQNLLKKKISINMKEHKKGKFVSRPQALAVSYSQVRKSFQGCKKFIGSKRPKTSKKSSRKVSRKDSKKNSKKNSRKNSKKSSKKRSYGFEYEP